MVNIKNPDFVDIENEFRRISKKEGSIDTTQNADTKTIVYTNGSITIKLIKYMGDQKENSYLEVVSKSKNLSYTINYINEIIFEDMEIKIDSKEIQNKQERMDEKITFDY